MFFDNVLCAVSEIKNRGDMIYHNLTDKVSFLHVNRHTPVHSCYFKKEP